MRNLFKYLPVSTEAVRSVEIDEKSDRGEAITESEFIDATYVDKGQKLDHVTSEEKQIVRESPASEPAQPLSRILNLPRRPFPRLQNLPSTSPGYVLMTLASLEDPTHD